MTAEELQKYEPSIVIAKTEKEAYLSGREARRRRTKWTRILQRRHVHGRRSAEGVITRTCTQAAGSKGCPSGTW